MKRYSIVLLRDSKVERVDVVAPTLDEALIDFATAELQAGRPLPRPCWVDGPDQRYLVHLLTGLRGEVLVELTRVMPLRVLRRG